MAIHFLRNLAGFFGIRPRKQYPIVSARRRMAKRDWHLRRALTVEVLEGRVVPTSPLVSSVLDAAGGFAVAGTVYEDLNADGVKNNGENGVSGWTVYLDLDQNGTLNQDAVGDWEPSAVTNVDGDYAINHLRPGAYRFAEVMQSGWTPTAAVSQDVVVAGDTNKVDFFNFSGGDIVGTVWNDLDGDGVRAADPVSGAFTEPGLANWTVFLDANNDQILDPAERSTLTDADGHYTFTNMPPGIDFEVTEILPAGWEPSRGFDIHQTVAAVARSQVTQDFANFSLTNGAIQGTIWNDVNADGVRNTDPVTGEFTEPGLAGWTVFLDLNGNRTLDAGEITTLTNAAGAYTFLGLPAGDHEVTEVLPPGWYTAPTFDVRQTVTVAGGEVTIASDFANFTVLNGSIRGTVWNDLNRNGIRDINVSGAFTDPGLADWTVYLDLNSNRVADAGEPTALTDSNGRYLFADLQVGDYEIREVLPTGWEATTGYDDDVAVTVFSGAESVAPDFANFNLSTAIPGSVSGVVWNDLNGNGIRDVVPASGAFSDPGLAGWTVFADLNNNGLLDATDPNTTSALDGSYSLTGILPGSVTVIEQANAGWRPTAPTTARRTIALKNGETATGLDFGNWALQDSTIRGVVFADTNKDGTRNAGERGLNGVTVYLDLDNNGALDAGEPQTLTSADLYFTPTVDEAGSYSFTHLAAGTYTVRAILPAILSATPAGELQHTVTLAGAESRNGVDTAAVFRPTEIHGVKFDDADGDHLRDAGEAGVGGVTVFVDLDRDNSLDVGEPTALTAGDGSYSFSGLAPGAYVVRELLSSGYEATYPTTAGGILWPQGVSNPAVGAVTPASITTSLAVGESYRQSVSITLPGTGALTNLVDVFLLFDDTGSFVNNSPIVRGAFPTIISQLQAALPGIDLGFGVGRFEEYGSFAYEYATGRPFILNQPIVAASTAGYMTAIQAALNRTTPGYGGDQPETDIEALYQLVTGLGFDGNNNGSVLDSGVAGLASTQLNPGSSGDVPSFASFQADAAGNVMAAAGSIGGGGFRAGALPIILVATDTGFAFQPKGETTITGVGGLTLPTSALTQTSRATTPFNSGAGLQQTVTGLNALGALVIGLGTNPQANLDPRQGLEALSTLTGAVNRSATTIANGTADPIAPGDPLYFQIASGFASSVANGVVTAIQNAVTNVAVDITIQASDPRVRIINHTGVRSGVGAGQTATFEIEFIGDGVPHRFDLQFVRNGTNVILGSIPVVLGTPIPGDGYEFEDLDEGEICTDVDFGSRLVTTTTTAPTIIVNGGTFTYDGAAHAASASASGLGGAAVAGTFEFSYNGSTTAPAAAGVYDVAVTFISSDPTYTNAAGSATLTINPATPTITVTGGAFSFDGGAHAAAATATGIDGASIVGSFTFTYTGSAALPTSAGVYDIGATFSSGDSNYANATGTGTLTIDAVAPTVVVTGGSFTYDGVAHDATATASGIDGGPVAGTFTFTYDGSAVLPLNAGAYAVEATFTSADPNYTSGIAIGSVLIGKATPVFTNLSTPVIDAGTSFTTITGNLAAGVVFPTGDSVTGSLNSIAQSGSVDGNGNFALSFATATLSPGSYPITVSYAGNATNFDAGTDGGTTLTVKAVPQPIDVVGLNISAIAGAPITRAVATIKNTLGSASSYEAVISWGDGGSSIGVISGAGETLSVAGTHTYADPAAVNLQVTIVDKLGLGLPTTATSVATVISLGLAVGRSKEAVFWHSRSGQNLIARFNGGGGHTELANWLAGNFSNLYGANAGNSNLTGKTNADVAIYFQKLWRADHHGVATEVLTTALNVYATTTSLGGKHAAAFGFKVTTTGLGARTFNVGKKGAAVGVPNRTRLNVFQLLRGVDRLAVNGVPYNGDYHLQHLAQELFEDLNSK